MNNTILIIFLPILLDTEQQRIHGCGRSGHFQKALGQGSGGFTDVDITKARKGTFFTHFSGPVNEKMSEETDC